MSVRSSRIALGVGLGFVALGYGSAFFPDLPRTLGAAALLLGSVVALWAMALLGAGVSAPASARRLRGPLLLGFGLLLVGLGGGLWAPDPAPGDRLFGGLPWPAALLVYGAGLLPLLVVPLAYAWTFDAAGMSPEEIDDLLARARAAAETPEREAPR
jgi:hypothetical protein